MKRKKSQAKRRLAQEEQIKEEIKVFDKMAIDRRNAIEQEKKDKLKQFEEVQNKKHEWFTQTVIKPMEQQLEKEKQAQEKAL